MTQKCNLSKLACEQSIFGLLREPIITFLFTPDLFNHLINHFTWINNYGCKQWVSEALETSLWNKWHYNPSNLFAHVPLVYPWSILGHYLFLVTVRFSEQIMSADKYPSIFSCQMATIVYLWHYTTYQYIVHLFQIPLAAIHWYSLPI